MSKGRMEAFSDGVIAILITIMVLELKVPREAELAALLPLVPVFLSYVISFLFLGIYWSNHHHLMVVTERVSGGILWANLHLLFWLSLVPFATGWWANALHHGRRLLWYGAAVCRNRLLHPYPGPHCSSWQGVGTRDRGWPGF
jgi:uncharacterized membrane protein